MSTIVIMPGGFHPFHAGHYSLYQSALKAFPGAEVYVAATNDQSERPFPFALKEKLAKLAGVAPGHFVQVKSPFQAKEITQNYNPEEDVLIFVRSEKDRNEPPKPGGTKKDGSPAYFQPWTGKDLQPFSKHAYIEYLPTVEFGPGITSATQIRNAWPTLNDKRKTAMVMSLYPATQKNPKLAQNVVQMFDQVMGGQEGVAEDITESRESLFSWLRQQFPTWPEYVVKDFLYQQAKTITSQQQLSDWLQTTKNDFGKVKWRLEKLPITIDIFTPKTQRMIKSREGGSSNPFSVPKDAERHAQQLKMIQQQGVRTEPIIIAKLDNGYDLIEGWHRTIQHLKAFPEGYTGPAYVGYGATYTSESKQGVAEGKIKLSTDPNWYGAEVGDYKASGPVVNIPANSLVGFEPDDKMNQPASKANVEKIVAGLKQGAKLPPLLVRQYKNGYQVLDGHHRFWAYKLLGVKSIPAQVVPDEDVEEVGKQGVAEGKQPGRPVIDAILKVMPIAQEIWFHGSRATGKHRRNSDTDILVVVPDNLVGDKYLGAVRILQKLNSHFDNYDIQPTKLGTNIHHIAQEEGRLLWSKNQGVAEGFGLPMPSTYEQETEPLKSHGARRIIAMTNEDINMSESLDYLEEK